MRNLYCVAEIEQLIAERVKPDSPMLSALDTPVVRIRCIEYSHRTTDKVVRHWRNLRHVGGPLYVSDQLFGVDKEKPYCSNPYYNLYILFDGGKDAIKWQGILENTAARKAADEFVAMLDIRYKLATLPDYIAYLDEREKTRYVDLANIEFIKQYDPDRADRYAVSRAEYKKRQEALDAEQRQQRAAEDAAYVEAQNAKVYALCSAAVDTIRNGGTIENTTVTFYRERYGHSEYCLFNFLLNEYGVDAPIRTKGWIAAHIDSVTVTNGHLSGGKWHRKKKTDKMSDSFYAVIGDLINAVKYTDHFFGVSA